MRCSFDIPRRDLPTIRDPFHLSLSLCVCFFTRGLSLFASAQMELLEISSSPQSNGLEEKAMAIFAGREDTLLETRSAHTHTLSVPWEMIRVEANNRSSIYSAYCTGGEGYIARKMIFSSSWAGAQANMLGALHTWIGEHNLLCILMWVI